MKMSDVINRRLKRNNFFLFRRLYSILLAGAVSGLIFCLLFLTGTNVLASENGKNQMMPPLKYKLDEVNIHIIRNPVNPASSVREIKLSGTGNAILEQDGQTQEFKYPEKDLMALLDHLYNLRFFELPNDYRTKYSVFLKEDGTVNTAKLRLADMPSTSICFSTANYKKCVTFTIEGPGELKNVVQQTFDEVNRLINQKQTAKQ